MHARPVVLKVLRSILINGLVLLGAWGLLQVIKVLIQIRAPGEIVWGVSALPDRLGTDGLTVADLVGKGLRPTIELLVAALIVAALLAAVQMAVFWRSSRQGSGPALRAIRFLWLDIWKAAPPFYLGLMLLLVFAVWWGVLPSGSVAPPGAGFATRLRYLALPAFTLGIVPAMLLTSKGLRELEARRARMAGRPRLLLGHLSLFTGAEALRMVGLLLALSAITGWQSLSRTQFFTGILLPDAPVAIGLAWVLVIMVVLGRLLADLIQIADERLLPAASAPDIADAEKKPSRKGSSYALWVGLTVFGVLGLAALCSAWTAAHDPFQTNLRARLASPSLSYPLGADYVGRDILSRVIHGVRFEMLMALVVIGGVAVFSVPWSALIVWLRGRGGWRWRLGREATMWPVDVLTAFPWTVMAALVVAYTYGVPGVERQNSGGDIPMFIAILLLVLVPRGVKMWLEGLDRVAFSRGAFRRALAAGATLLPMVAAAALFVSITLGSTGAEVLGPASPRPSLGNVFMEMRDYLSTTAVLTKVIVPLVGVLLVASLLWIGEYLLDRARIASGAVWSRGLE